MYTCNCNIQSVVDWKMHSLNDFWPKEHGWAHTISTWVDPQFFFQLWCCETLFPPPCLSYCWLILWFFSLDMLFYCCTSVECVWDFHRQAYRHTQRSLSWFCKMVIVWQKSNDNLTIPIMLYQINRFLSALCHRSLV